MMLNSNKAKAFLAGLFFPISSFIYAVLHPNSKYFKLLFVLFFTFIGGAICVSSAGEADIVRSIASFKDACLMRNIGFIEYFNMQSRSNQIDYYSIFMQWFVSRFTSDHRVYLGILAMVMSLFFANNITYVVQHSELSKINVFLLVVLVLIPQAVFLTHRWWTALQVFLFGLLPVVVEKKYMRLIWCAVSAIVFHFSFIYPLIILLIAILIPKKRGLWVYLALYILTLFMESFDFNIFSSYMELWMSEQVAGRTDMYINYELGEHNFLSQSARLVMKIANAILCFWMLIRHGKQVRNNDLLRRFFVVTLLLGSFANMASLTEWGWRYFELTNMCFITYYMLFLSDQTGIIDRTRFFWWISPLFIYFIIYQVRGYLDIIGPYQLMFGNYFTMWFLNDTNTVLELIKGAA